MSHVLPLPGDGIHPGPPGARLRVDPVALAEVAGQLQQWAAAVRSGAPALRAAWLQAAGALAGEHSGVVLEGALPASGAAFDACAASVEALARTLRDSAERYGGAEAAAVPAAPEKRLGVWIP